MQTQLTAAVKKAPGNPFVRVKPGVFGLLRYPELTPEERGRIPKALTAVEEVPDQPVLEAVEVARRAAQVTFARHALVLGAVAGVIIAAPIPAARLAPAIA